MVAAWNYRYASWKLNSSLSHMTPFSRSKEHFVTERIMAERIWRAVALLLLLSCANSWILPHQRISHRHINVRSKRKGGTTYISSTAFEADFYSNPFEDDDEVSSLAVPQDTQLILGLNKYTHDTALCAADAKTGQVLFAMAKERLSRKKHDAGNVASLVETCLECLDLQLDNIQKVVMNNHHHRVLPLEERLGHMEWESGLRINGGMESGYDEPENILSNAERHELSHHLAHAYSTATQAPFDAGLCVVMDGMGETYRTMLQGLNDPTYTSDLSFGQDTFQCIPRDIAQQAATSPFDFREAESAYVFRKNAETSSIDIWPVFKRFTAEHSPPTLYNSGFENMDSVGAVYSRASSHIFGDWNSCGKVMGLAPWAKSKWTDDNGSELSPKLHDSPIMEGSLYSEKEGECLRIDRTLLEGLPFSARNDPDLFDSKTGTMKKRYDFDDEDSSEQASDKRLPAKVALDAIALASRVQDDLETVVMDFVQKLKEETGETNLCIAGGVGLNSVLNGRLAREIGFEQTYISPYPGDDGIAVGCCAYGLYGNERLEKGAGAEKERPKLWKGPISPYQGPDPSEMDIKEAIEYAAPWLEVEAVRNEDQRMEMMAQEVESGGVIAWYRSRSELGPRALGHRSILADPRKKGLVRFINENVKSRESFRPFAPSVLAEEATKWFDLGDRVPADANVSPFMSMTALVHEDKRSQIPAVTHVDGSSRMQTVTKDAEPVYHKFISKFFALTGVPLVLNTSFNTLPSEPIVESPSDAIRSFLYSMGSLEMLIMDDYVIKRKKPNLRSLLGEASEDGQVKTEPALPCRAGAAQIQSTFDVDKGKTDEDKVRTVTNVRMPDRPMHGNGNEWFELLDELEGELLSICDGTVTMNDIIGYYTAVDEDQSLGQEAAVDAENLLQNIVQRFVRLYEHTLIGW